MVVRVVVEQPAPELYLPVTDTKTANKRITDTTTLNSRQDDLTTVTATVPVMTNVSSIIARWFDYKRNPQILLSIETP